MHPRFAHLVFALILSGLMSLVVSGIATARSLGLSPELPLKWLASWGLSWTIAFPLVLVLAPLVRRFVERITRAPQ